MLKVLLRLVSVLLLSIVLMSRFGFTELLASEISSMELVAQANLERQRKGLNTLAYNKKLERAAFAKAENMFKEQYWAHYGPNKESPWQFIIGAGYQYSYAGENLAKGFTSSQAVHDAWMASPTHRANILDGQFQEVGIAVVKGNLQGTDTYLVVQMFGSTHAKPTGTTDTNPSLKINTPKDGDILEDGITDIRGETSQVVSSSISLYLNQSYLGASKITQNGFTFEAPLVAMQGDQTIVAKGVGDNDAPLMDSVVVTIVSGSKAESELKDCLKSRTSYSELIISYTCERVNSTLTATIGSNRYTQAKKVNEVAIPLAMLPKEDVSVIITVGFTDSTSLAAVRKLSELRKVDDTNTLGAMAGRTLSSLTTISPRQMIFGLFGIAFLLLLFYAAELMHKRSIMHHRFELFTFLSFFSILLLTFNMGVIRV